ncbi:hypothetical protein QE152_g24411 [Popillia japonica]|uniref:Uncharacterized protein n=1 Tax=Popillia japonica TaxID=7064 RepID=A0AAW1KFU7_POPJA
MNKVARVSSALRKFVWKNNCTIATSKVRIYKIFVGPMIAYSEEAKTHTPKTKRTSPNIVRVLTAIKTNRLRDHRRSCQIRKECETEDAVRWVLKRRRFWKEHLSRMVNKKLMKIVRNGKLASKRPP